MTTADLVVVGLGAMGCATAAHAAERGLRVVGVERGAIGHAEGSSHGDTRIIRLGLFEGGHYVALARRSAELWDELGSRGGETLIHRCGSLEAGPEASELVAGSVAACREHGVAHEVLDGRDVARRFPALRVPAPWMAVLQPGSGFVLAEDGVMAHARAAVAAGAELRGHERVTSWRRDGDGVRVVTDRGEIAAGALAVTTGAWGVPGVPVAAERQVAGWFLTRGDATRFTPQRLPVWIVDTGDPTAFFYGFPHHRRPGVKVARFGPGEPTDPDGPRRAGDDGDEEVLRAFLRRHMPDADGSLAALGTCMFENTPDGHPVVDRLPGDVPGWMAVGWSGHGFKHSPAVGEALAALAATGTSPVDLTPFAAARLTRAG